MIVNLIQELSKEYQKKVKTELKNIKKEDDGDVIMESVKIKSKKDNNEPKNVTAVKTSQRYVNPTPSSHHSLNTQYISSSSYNPSCHSSINSLKNRSVAISPHHASSILDHSSNISKHHTPESSTTSYHFSPASRNPSNSSHHYSTLPSSSRHLSSSSSSISSKINITAKSIGLMRSTKMMPKRRPKLEQVNHKPKKPQIRIPENVKKSNSTNISTTSLTKRKSSSSLTQLNDNTLKPLISSVLSDDNDDIQLLNTKTSPSSHSKRIKLMEKEEKDLNRLNVKQDLISLDDPEENIKVNDNDIMDID